MAFCFWRQIIPAAGQMQPDTAAELFDQLHPAGGKAVPNL